MTDDILFLFLLYYYFFSNACFWYNNGHVKIQRGPHQSLYYWLTSVKNINPYVPPEITEKVWVCNWKACQEFFFCKHSIFYMCLMCFQFLKNCILLIDFISLFFYCGKSYTTQNPPFSPFPSVQLCGAPTMLCKHHHYPPLEHFRLPQLKFCTH